MNQALNKGIGRRLRDRREHLHITREKLCEMIDVSPQFLSEVERGVKGLSVDKLLVICDGLGLSTEYVLRGKKAWRMFPRSSRCWPRWTKHISHWPRMC